jgi:predicted Zn-dependent protease
MADSPKRNHAVHAALEPAQGFYDLGLYYDAWNALDELPIEDAGHSMTIALRLDILIALDRVADAVALGSGACRIWPQNEAFFCKTAAALIALDDHEKAKNLLWAAPLSLRSRAAYWYDLGRCQARTGEIEAAMKSIQECIQKDKAYRTRALDDADLEAVWKSLKVEIIQEEK